LIFLHNVSRFPKDRTSTENVPKRGKVFLGLRKFTGQENAGLKIGREGFPYLPDGNGQLITNGQGRDIQDGGYLFIFKTIFFHQLKNEFALRGELPDHLPDLPDHICGDTHFHRATDGYNGFYGDGFQADNLIPIILSDIV
jgi:hypothetical protein